MQTNFELAQHFPASKIVQARDRSADPAGARVQSRGGTDASRELLKAAARRGGGIRSMIFPAPRANAPGAIYP
jgi:hypothetical protein